VEETLFYNASWRYSSPYRCYFVSRLLLGFLFSCFVVNASAEVRVLTSIKPLQLIAAAVQEGVGSPAVLLPSGASAHNYALRPSDVRRVQEVQLLYWIGPDMESFLPRVLAARQRPTVAVQDLPGLHLRHFGQTQPAAEHDDEHEHESSAADGEHDHAHRPGTLDAHLWLLPANAQVIATRMAADLSAADPLNTPRYQANLQAFTARLTQLDIDIKARLLGVTDKPYFVFHEAFDYFEEAYGLKHAGVFSVASEVQPGAQHVAQMRERLQAAGPTCVFSEPPMRPRLAQTLSAGLPVTLAELDAMGGKLAVNGTGYEQLLNTLADDLSGCLRRL
jgi:zinc transport system substrate-binding protein